MIKNFFKDKLGYEFYLIISLLIILYLLIVLIVINY